MTLMSDERPALTNGESPDGVTAEILGAGTGVAATDQGLQEAPEPAHKHGSTVYYIEGEGFVGGAAEAADAGALGAAPEPARVERAFRFMRLFPDLPRFEPAVAALHELGQAMDDTPNLKDHPSLPAGYTYFGQFLDHDITFDQTEGLIEDLVTEEELRLGRSPSLDLDSLYGRGPDLETDPIYEDDKVHLRVGVTDPVAPAGSGPEGAALPNDLPRGLGGDTLKAVIGDPRNDENLAVAQLHLAFLKFHNVVVDRLAESGLYGAALFAQARRVVTLHYQWIVIHDFLARLVEPAILERVLRGEGRIYRTPAGQEPAMPIEFSVAAFRFGHSMIRDNYTWNRVFEFAGLNLLFVFSGVSGTMFGRPSLPSNWPIDWRRFFDFSDAPGVEPPQQLNLTRSIDTGLAIGLRDLLDRGISSGRPPLAVLNLLRGRRVGLPTGQAVADFLGLPVMTPEQLRQGSQGPILQRHGFDTQTPLWYYILKEAEVFHDGERLGPVGSTLLAETFVGLIENSRTSVLAPEQRYWRPTLPSLRPGHYTMVDLLLLVNDLDPLGPGLPQLPPPPPPPTIHVVQPGDTLRNIAARFLGDERRWREIFNANRDTITHPDRIRPGMRLVIPNS